jgi:hypothetical protein
MYVETERERERERERESCINALYQQAATYSPLNLTVCIHIQRGSMKALLRLYYYG